MLTPYHYTYQNDTTNVKPCDHSDGKTRAYYGAHRFKKKDSYKTFSIPIIDVKFPPFAKVNKSDFNAHDLAIQVLKYPLKFSSKTRAICLPDPGEEFYGRSVITVGWAQTHRRINYSRKNELKNSGQIPDLKVVRLKVSKKRYNHTKLIGTVLDKKKGVEEQDPCRGDFRYQAF